MERKELESKISHFESMIVAWNNALTKLQNSEIAEGLVINGPIRKNIEVRQAMVNLKARTSTLEEEYNGEIDKLQKGLEALRLELIEIDVLKFSNTKRLSILEKPLLNPYCFVFDYKVFRRLLTENTENNVELSLEKIAPILKYTKIKSIETFPYYIDILQFIFALGLDLEDVRKSFSKIESLAVSDIEISNNKKLTNTKTDAELLESKKNYHLTKELQWLLCYEYNNRKSRYSVSKLIEAGMNYSTYYNLFTYNQPAKKTSTLNKLRYLFEVENNIRLHIPNFDFVNSGVIKYNPPEKNETEN